MIKECAENIVTYGSDTTRPTVDIEGVLVELKLQSLNEGDARTRGINLLGTDFLNSVVLIDDFMSKNIMILKRATPPVARV